MVELIEITGAEVKTEATEYTCTTNACVRDTDEIDGVLVDYIDLGIQETPWGAKPQCKVVFETDRKKENGYPITVTRTLTKSLHEMSALRPLVESWYGRSLSEDELTKGVKLEKQIGKPAVLVCQDTISKNGYPYLKLLNLKPATEKKLKPSGSYRRFEPEKAANH